MRVSRITTHVSLTSNNNNNYNKGQRIVPGRVSNPNKETYVNHQPNETKRQPTNWSANARITAKDRRRWTQPWASHSATRAWIRYRRQTRSRSSWAAGRKEPNTENPKGTKLLRSGVGAMASTTLLKDYSAISSKEPSTNKSKEHVANVWAIES